MEYATQSKEEGKIFVIVGKAASGKDTISNDIAKEFELDRFITCTSRPKRIGEIDGKDYHFINYDEFEEDEFIAVEEYNNWRYGVRVSDIDPFKNYIIILTPSGYYEFKDKFRDKVVGIYIMAPMLERMRRYLNRDNLTTEQATEALRRSRTDEQDFFEFEFEANYLVLNNREYNEVIRDVGDIILMELTFNEEVVYF